MDEQDEAALYDLVISLKRKVLRLEASEVAMQQTISEADSLGLIPDNLRAILAKFPQRRDKIWEACTSAVEKTDSGIAARLDEGREEPPFPPMPEEGP